MWFIWPFFLPLSFCHLSCLLLHFLFISLLLSYQVLSTANLIPFSSPVFSSLTACLPRQDRLCDANQNCVDYNQCTMAHTHTHLSLGQLNGQYGVTCSGPQNSSYGEKSMRLPVPSIPGRRTRQSAQTDHQSEVFVFFSF